MTRFQLEFIVGLFVLSGIAAITYMAVTYGGFQLYTNDTNYSLNARFESVAGLREGAAVEMSGVPVGLVSQISFDELNYQAIVTIELPNTIKLPIDSIASIRSSGLIGDKYLKISVGGDEELLEAGDEFEQTESSVDLEELISKFIFSSDNEQ